MLIMTRAFINRKAPCVARIVPFCEQAERQSEAQSGRRRIIPVRMVLRVTIHLKIYPKCNALRVKRSWSFKKGSRPRHSFVSLISSVLLMYIYSDKIQIPNKNLIIDHVKSVSKYLYYTIRINQNSRNLVVILV